MLSTSILNASFLQENAEHLHDEGERLQSMLQEARIAGFFGNDTDMIRTGIVIAKPAVVAHDGLLLLVLFTVRVHPQYLLTCTQSVACDDSVNRRTVLRSVGPWMSRSLLVPYHWGGGGATASCA
jgi:hypothetical protein